jgi:hypothetical protein
MLNEVDVYPQPYQSARLEPTAVEGVVLQMEDKMEKERDQQKLQGKAFQVNENTVEEGEPIGSIAPQNDQSSGNRKRKVEGKAFQVNENSVEDQ